MADNGNNILKQLQQHPAEPPADAFEKAWQAIMQLEKPVEENISGNEKKIFTTLQKHSLAAPPYDFHAITKQANKLPVRSLPVGWLRAAAVLLIVAAGVALYVTIRNNKTGETGYAVVNNDKKTMSVQPADSLKLNAVDSLQPSAQVMAGTENKGRMIINGRRGNAAYYPSDAGDLYENDLMLTLVNYKTKNWETFFSKAISEKRIVLNQYSYHNISDKMAAMLQDIFLTRKNGKPSRKARKTKRKFEKWRKKDEKYFDKDLQKNPADIIDLSEFILKNN